MNVERLFDLTGKIAVVTGGLGQLGMSFSSALAEHGARVAVLDVRTEPIHATERFHGHVESGAVRKFQADITDKIMLQETIGLIEKQMGIPEILINNAALDSPPDAPLQENGPFEDFPESSLDQVIDLNVKGLFFCCQVVGGRMASHGRGSIINISSIYGLVSPDQNIYQYKRENGRQWYKPAAYSLTKSAILNLTRYLATYWSKKGVRVNTLTPAGVYNGQDERFLAEYTKRVPLGRMAKQDEYDGAVVFLASDASAYMTGSNLIIDGGWTAW